MTRLLVSDVNLLCRWQIQASEEMLHYITRCAAPGPKILIVSLPWVGVGTSLEGLQCFHTPHEAWRNQGGLGERKGVFVLPLEPGSGEPGVQGGVQAGDAS